MERVTHYAIEVNHNGQLYESLPIKYEKEKFDYTLKLFDSGIENLSIPVSEKKILFFRKSVLENSVITLSLLEMPNYSGPVLIYQYRISTLHRGISIE